MAGRRQHVDQIGNLGIGAIEGGIGDDGGIGLRIFRLQGAHHCHGRIGFVMDAEHDLHLAVIMLGKEGFEIAFQIRLAAVQGLQDCDIRAVTGGVLRRLHKTPDQGRGQHGIAGAGYGNRREQPTNIIKDTVHDHIREAPPARYLLRRAVQGRKG